ncbi:sushi, von Willebrand factor type A, EGF and pentraxin domain-containing protein 1-like [Centruroides vittatus]|uniref:sushi, von Willebrand factor type A, EGF and pentraxin domain-containing protein 1-like n=1 Tax=Centruroides vittatus TaxID=120091 RepID=UPI00350F492B
MACLRLIPMFYLLLYLANSNAKNKIKDCYLPASPLHGRYVENNVTDSEISITFSCDPDAYLIGSETLTCNSGKWNGTFPICITNNFKKLTMRKKNLTSLTDGDYKTCVNLQKETFEFQFDCDDNINSYIILRVIHDMKDFKVAHQVKNSMTNCTELSNNTIVQRKIFVIHDFNCTVMAGKVNTIKLYDSLRRVCEVKIYWQKNYSCFELNISSERGSIRYEYNNEDKSNYRYGTAAIYTCKNGYKMSGKSTRYCQHGRWSGNETTCTKTECDDFDTVENGKVTYTSKSIGGNAKLKCIRGYKPASSAVSLCSANNTWTPVSFKCEEITCPDLPTNIEGTYWIYEKPARVDRNATVKCYSNYFLPIEYSTIRCLPDGNWSIITACKDNSSPFSKTKLIIIAASIGAGSSALIFTVILCLVILRKGLIKKRNQSINNEQDQMEGNEYYTIIYDDIHSIKHKKPNSPLPKVPSCETEFNYSEPIDKNRNSEKGSQYMYAQPQDAIQVPSVNIRNSNKRRNSSADSTYWRDCGDFDDKADVFKTKIPSNASLPDFSITRSLLEDLYLSD